MVGRSVGRHHAAPSRAREMNGGALHSEALRRRVETGEIFGGGWSALEDAVDALLAATENRRDP